MVCTSHSSTCTKYIHTHTWLQEEKAVWGLEGVASCVQGSQEGWSVYLADVQGSRAGPCAQGKLPSVLRFPSCKTWACSSVRGDQVPACWTRNFRLGIISTGKFKATALLALMSTEKLGSQGGGGGSKLRCFFTAFPRLPRKVRRLGPTTSPQADGTPSSVLLNAGGAPPCHLSGSAGPQTSGWDCSAQLLCGSNLLGDHVNANLRQ